MKLHPEMKRFTVLKTIRLILEFIITYPISLILFHLFDILWRTIKLLELLTLNVRNASLRYGRLKYWKTIYRNAYHHKEKNNETELITFD